jgi:5-methylthioadenosine/S-adenosylhomocysteine deaminase
MTKNAIQLIHAEYVITCEADDGPLAFHTMVIENNLIIDILPTAAAKEKYPQAMSETFSHHTLMPGFVNTHTHLPMNYFRGIADDLSLENWLNHHIWPAEKKWLSSAFVYDAALFAMAEMIRSGTTCFNDMYFYLYDMARAAETACIRGFVGSTIIDFPTSWAKTSDEYFEKTEDFYLAYQNHALIKPTISPHSPYAVNEANLLRVKAFAETYNLKINLHLHENAFEVSQSIAKTGLTQIARMDELGLLNDRLIAIHMTQINDVDFQIIQRTKPHIVHCPESNMKLASGCTPLTKLISAGLNIALGTDSAASNNDLNMFSEMRTASLLAKLISQNPEALPAMAALKMATINGAKALGIDQITGSLKIGKAADFIAINLNTIETQPLFRPESHIVYSADRSQVTDVWVAGKRLMKNRQLTTIDEQAILATAKEWHARMTA